MTNRPIWEDGAGDRRPPIVHDKVTDVCVVGLGGSGLSAMDEALAHGASVIGIDRSTIGAEAAGRNGGFLKTGLTGPLHTARESWGDAAIPVYRMTLEEIERVFDQAGDDGWRVGSIRLATTPEEIDDCEVNLAALEAAGLPGTAYEGPLGVGLFFPVDGGFNPLSRCRRLARSVMARGAEIGEGTEAISIEPGRVVTPEATISARVIVVSVDGCLETLFPEIGARTTRLQMIGTEPDPDLDIRCPVYADFGFNYWQQLPDGRLAVGGARNLHSADEWTRDAGITASVQTDIERVLRDQVGSTAAVTHRWSGHSAYTPDGVPIGREVEEGVWVVGAYNGVGNVLGAVYARAAIKAGLRIDEFWLPDSGPQVAWAT
ncbi:MAG: FAD-binding oxidoreductase [Acidimicrobiia bacterium]|nr:FAD-binding oxidoreductase [Acidimicrobiia bacterium]